MIQLKNLDQNKIKINLFLNIFQTLINIKVHEISYGILQNCFFFYRKNTISHSIQQHIKKDETILIQRIGQTRCQIASDQSGRYRRKRPGKSRPIFHGAAQTNGVAASLMAPICAAVKSFNRNRTPTKETLFLSPRGQRLRKTSWRMRPCIFFFRPPFCVQRDRAVILAGKSISLLVFWWKSGRENRQPLTEAFSEI